MYADRVEAGTRRSVKERLNGNAERRVTGKRRREDDKWEHDLFEDHATPQLPSHKVGAPDLRLKLQKKGLQPTSRGGRNSVSGVRDLREKLSGTTTTQPVNAIQPKTKLEVVRQTNKSTGLDATAPLVRKVAIPVPKRNTTQKADTTVDEFLQSLGLEKYVITFQAEEVDMTALIHMTDDDLKAMGIPMGPRKKIILALESRKV